MPSSGVWKMMKVAVLPVSSWLSSLSSRITSATQPFGRQRTKPARPRSAVVDLEAEAGGQQHAERRQHAHDSRLLVGRLQHDHGQADVLAVLGGDELHQHALLALGAGRRVAAHLPVGMGRANRRLGLVAGGATDTTRLGHVGLGGWLRVGRQRLRVHGRRGPAGGRWRCGRRSAPSAYRGRRSPSRTGPPPRRRRRQNRQRQPPGSGRADSLRGSTSYSSSSSYILPSIHQPGSAQASRKTAESPADLGHLATNVRRKESRRAAVTQVRPGMRPSDSGKSKATGTICRMSGTARPLRERSAYGFSLA